jgi:hypothetical protein
LASTGDSSSKLRARLDARRDELEQTALTRIAAIADPAQVSDPSYVDGLREALAAALDYGLSAVDGTGETPSIPVAPLTQARTAARAGVSLETVLRRYAAGHGLLSDILLDEGTTAGVGAAELKSALRALAARYDRLVAAVSEEYGREATEPRGAEHRRYVLLRRLVAGDPLDATSLGYEFDTHHVALVASGQGVLAELSCLGKHLARDLLLAEPDTQLVWAWLGGQRTFGREELDFIASHPWPDGCALACGEPGQGLAGWRLSHRQAAAALPIARRGAEHFILYADVALLASTLQNDLFATFLRRAYLQPLTTRDDGVTAKATLRAYFGAAGNVSSTATTLGVTRKTVERRLATVEEHLDRSLDTVATELEVALRLDELESTMA